MEQKLIFLDIDGTILVPGEGIRQTVIDGLRKARNRGHMVFINSGRSISSMPQEIADMDLDGIVAGAGSDIWIHGQNAWRTSMPESLIWKGCRVLDEMNAIYIVENYDGSYMSREGKKVLLQEDILEDDNPEMIRWKQFFRGKKDLHFMDEWDPKKAPAAKITFILRKQEQVARIHELLDKDFYVAMFPVATEDYFNGELISKDANKGTAIRKTAEILKADFKNTIAFGDSMNDYHMIEAAAVGVAMGNADEKLKEIADRVCESVWEDGVIRELERMKII